MTLGKEAAQGVPGFKVAGVSAGLKGDVADALGRGREMVDGVVPPGMHLGGDGKQAVLLRDQSFRALRRCRG